jgi:hypothetical protein
MHGTSFISYSRADRLFARRLYEDLKSAGVHVWLDQVDIKPGEPWDAIIERTLNTSAALVVILTPESVASHSVLNEISYALNTNKRVVPVLLRDCTLPLRINRLHYTNFQNDYAAALSQLIATLSPSSDEPVTSPPPRVQPLSPPPSVSAKESQSVPQKPPTRSIRRNLGLVILISVVALGAAAYGAYRMLRPGLPLKPNPRYDDPALNDCRGIPECLQRRAQADRLLSVRDWALQPITSPLLSDCMSYKPCQDRKRQADRLRSEDWKNVSYNSPLLKDCMGYPPCDQAADQVNKIQTLDFKTIARDDPRRSRCFKWPPCSHEFPPPPQPSPFHTEDQSSKLEGFNKDNIPACCAILGGKRAEECQKWKKKWGRDENCPNQ